jgi:hypothetical protein
LEKGHGFTISRLKELRNYVNVKLNEMLDADKRNGAIVHLYGVTLAAMMITKKHWFCEFVWWGSE